MKNIFKRIASILRGRKRQPDFGEAARNIAVALKGEKWQQELMKETEEDYRHEIADWEKKKVEMKKVWDFQKRIIMCLREKPGYLWCSVTYNPCIYIRTKNFKLAHDVVKELGITLKKKVGSIGFSYDGKFDGISISVHGMETSPKCRLRKITKTRTVTETRFELVCDE